MTVTRRSLMWPILIIAIGGIGLPGGAVWVPLIILTIALYPVRLGFYWLTYGWLGADAIWLSFPVAAFAALVMAWWAYRYTGWREQALAEGEEEAREQAQTDGQPAGRLMPEV